MSDQENREEVLRQFYVVKFISRGRRPAIKKVDVVKGSWLNYNIKTKKNTNTVSSS